jgi:hypothetical protein
MITNDRVARAGNPEGITKETQRDLTSFAEGRTSDDTGSTLTLLLSSGKSLTPGTVSKFTVAGPRRLCPLKNP